MSGPVGGGAESSNARLSNGAPSLTDRLRSPAERVNEQERRTTSNEVNPAARFLVAGPEPIKQTAHQVLVTRCRYAAPDAVARAARSA